VCTWAHTVHTVLLPLAEFVFLELLMSSALLMVLLGIGPAMSLPCSAVLD